jgi:hypothetical protein
MPLFSVSSPLPFSFCQLQSHYCVAAQLLAGGRRRIEKRNKAKKDSINGVGEDDPVRDSWMTELPQATTKAFGLGARTFRKSSSVVEQDVSAWTDTPAEKLKKMEDRAKRAAAGVGRVVTSADAPKVLNNRDDELHAQVVAYNASQRPKSLMDLHSEKAAKKARKEGRGTSLRKPFDPEFDLEVRNVDPKKNNSMFQDAAGFNSRFSSSGFKTGFG